MLDEAGRLNDLDAIHCLRDPTRGGVATTLNELAGSSEVCIEIHEDAVPVREEVKGACEILGLDPLYVANEGKLLAIVAADAAESMVARMRENPFGAEACIIGDVKAEPKGIVAMRTGFGGTRIVDMLAGDSCRVSDRTGTYASGVPVYAAIFSRQDIESIDEFGLLILAAGGRVWARLKHAVEADHPPKSQT